MLNFLSKAFENAAEMFAFILCGILYIVLEWITEWDWQLAETPHYLHCVNCVSVNSTIISTAQIPFLHKKKNLI